MGQIQILDYIYFLTVCSFWL